MPRTLARRRERVNIRKIGTLFSLVVLGHSRSMRAKVSGARTKAKWPKVSPIEHALPRGTLCDARSRGTTLSSAVKSETESAGARSRDLLTLPRIGSYPDQCVLVMHGTGVMKRCTCVLHQAVVCVTVDAASGVFQPHAPKVTSK